MIRLRGDILELLKKSGYSTYRLKKDKLIGGATLTRISKGDTIDLITLDKLCALTGCHPVDLLEYTPEEPD